MSGFCGIARFDGAPVDVAAVETMTRSMAYRGPDRQSTFSAPSITLGHTLLATTPLALLEAQPAAYDGVIVVADARIDAREELLADLRAARCEIASDALDSGLIAAAYGAWGDDAPAHLAGDFSFALWDAPRRRLFAARDRFGLRPFFFARRNGELAFANTLAALLEHVPRDVDEHTLAEFVAFGYNTRLDRTTYAAVERLPPAHRLAADANGIRIDRYWSLPAPGEPIRISGNAAVARFRELFTRAVADRARSGHVVISLSGGVDSTSVAATLARLERRPETSAVTVVSDAFGADPERHFARVTAEALAIPLEFQSSDGYELFERWDDRRVAGVEPVDDPLTARYVDNMRMLAGRARVALTGQGGDAVLYTSHSYFFDLLKRGRVDRVALEAAWYAVTRRRRPPLLLRSQLLRAFGLRQHAPKFPRWIHDDVIRAYGLRDRWQEVYGVGGPRLHPFRGEAARFLAGSQWPNLFETYDAGWTGAPVEIATPFFDVRLVEFLFTLPPMPHFADKDLVRRSMRGWLPDEVRLRPKTPLVRDPVLPLFRRTPERWIGLLADVPEIGRWIDRRILSGSIRSATADDYLTYQQTLPVVLARWLQP